MPRLLISLMVCSLALWTMALTEHWWMLLCTLAAPIICFVMWNDYDKKVNGNAG